MDARRGRTQASLLRQTLANSPSVSALVDDPASGIPRACFSSPRLHEYHVPRGGAPGTGDFAVKLGVMINSFYCGQLAGATGGVRGGTGM